ncbi:MAG: DEAD/DEAH box helicase family protein [Clostridia bacterium]|nr:DEAD/DEAH box helicase family protein [Clostridia bacterium]
MSITLRKHNQIAYEKIKDIFRTKNRAAVIHPTGTGKSILALELIEENKDKKALYLAPSNAILHNIKKTIFDVGMTMSDFPNLQRMTYQKLIRLSDEEMEALKADFIVVDEFQHCGAPEYEKGVNRLLKSNPNAKVLGLSATPIRFLDQGRDMAEELFGENIASEMTLEEAINEGILPEGIYVGALYAYNQRLEDFQEEIDKIPNMERKKDAQRYLKKLRDKLDDATKNLPELLANYMTNKNGKYIVFCKDIDDMKEKEEQANVIFGRVNQNIKIYSVSSERNIKQNDRTLTSFEQDNEEDSLKLLFSINMLNEGYHLGDLDGVIMMRPTMSPTVFIQQIGRALSVKKSNDKKPLIIDLVNNYDSCKIIEDFCERMSQYESSGEARKNSKRKSNLTIFDNTKEIRDIIDKIISFCNREKTIDEKIDELVNWFKRYPIARMDSKEIYDKIEDILKAYEPSARKQKLLLAEYNRLLKEYQSLSSKKVREGLTTEQLEKCREGNLGGKFGTPDYFKTLSKKYRINEKKIKYIIYRYGSVENFIEAYFKITFDRLDEKVLGGNIRTRFNIRDLNGSRGLDDLFDKVVNHDRHFIFVKHLPKMGNNAEWFFYDGDKLLSYIDNLSEKDKEITKLMYGIEKDRAYTYKEIAERYEVSRSRIYNIETVVINKFAKQRRDFTIVQFINMLERPHFGEAKEKVRKLKEMIFKSNIIFYPDEEFANEPVTGIDIEELSYLFEEIKMLDPICTWAYSEDSSNKLGIIVPKQALGISLEQPYNESDACRYANIFIPDFITQVPNLSEETRKLALDKIKQYGYDKPVAPQMQGIPIESLGLSEKQYNVLKWNNIHVVEQLMSSYLTNIKNSYLDIDLLSEKDKKEILERIEAFIQESDKKDDTLVGNNEGTSNKTSLNNEAEEQPSGGTSLEELRKMKMQLDKRIQELDEKESEAKDLLKSYKELREAKKEKGASTPDIFND